MSEGTVHAHCLKRGLNRAPYLVVSVFYFFVLCLIVLFLSSLLISLGLLSIVLVLLVAVQMPAEPTEKSCWNGP